VTVRRLFVALTSFALLLSATATTALADSPDSVGTQSQLTLERIGTTHIVAGSSPIAVGNSKTNEIGPDPEEAGGGGDVHGGGGTPPVLPTVAPKPKSQNVVDATGTTHFAGLNHFDQRFAGAGDPTWENTQFSLEPPDQGLCVGKGFVVETINTAIRVRNASTGAFITQAEPLNQFFNLAPEIDRVNGIYGDFTSDPKCYYDPANGGHWFVTLLQLGVVPATGDFSGTSEELIAVSAGSNPTGAFYLYKFDTTNDGSNGITHPLCPCYGDQPLLGADKYGFYISTNEFPLFANGFNGAFVYAISKSALTSGSANKVNAFYEPTLAENQAYSIQPATTPQGGNYAGENSGTEYFLSALEFTGGLDNRIALWAMTNTSSINSTHPHLSLNVKVLKSETYGFPPVVPQKDGSLPLRDAVGLNEPIAPLNSNDDRMNQTVYVDGQIWGAVNTVIQDKNGSHSRVGIAWFSVRPSTGHHLDGWVTDQGYVSVNKDNVFFPSIAANTHGDVMVAFTLAGPDYYPSAAYARIDQWGGAGPVRVVSWGVGPADGFTGYLSLDPPQFGGTGVERWGDYSAATADANGNLWFATETINQTCDLETFLADTYNTCGRTRSTNANWGTIIAKVHP
jgi:hypothetical protein